MDTKNVQKEFADSNDFVDFETGKYCITVLDPDENIEYRLCCAGSGGGFVLDMNNNYRPDKFYLFFKDLQIEF